MTPSSELSQFDFNPYSFNAVALFIIGLLSVIYLLRLKEKTAASWFLTAGLIGFTIGMVTMFFSAIVLWGSVLTPLTDVWAVVSMATMIGFSYHYPQKVNSREATMAKLFAICLSLLAIGVSLSYTYQILKLHSFDTAVPPVFWFLNPIMFLTALLVSIRRTVAIQQQPKGWRNMLAAFYRPSTRPARLLRNFSLALSLGLIQGVATVLLAVGLLHPLLATYAINISLLLMVVAIVYASFELTRQQPGLIIRLVGLSLVTLLAILSAFGIFAANTATTWVDEQNISHMETVRSAIRAGELAALPAEVAYVVAWPDAGQAQLLYARQSSFDFQSLTAEQRQSVANTAPTAVWIYFIESRFQRPERDAPVTLRYGDNPAGSFYQYAGYTFREKGQAYEVGFSLDEMSKTPHAISQGMIIAVIGSSLFILIVFPSFFRTNLIRPLNRLLTGVRQVDTGDLNIAIPVVYEDEVGFLTAAFNKMAASLQDELSQRQQAEADLRQLAASLEQRVADRTHELSALYDVSTAASQSQDSQTLLTESLARAIRALDSAAGFITLLDETETAVTPQTPDAPPIHQLTVHQNIPPDWLAQIEKMMTSGDLLETVIQQGETVLIADTTTDPRLPACLQTTPMVILISPLPAAGQIVGLLGVFRELGQRYNVDEIALLISIAGQVGSAAQTDRLRQRAAILEERQRLARDLHDSVIQSLYGLAALTEAGKIRAERGNPADERADPASERAMFTKIGKTARQAIREMRLFIYQLRPPILAQEGLVNALDLRLAAVEGRSDLRARLHAAADIHLPPPVEAALYQIAQEALNNSLKHAQAASVTVSLRRQDDHVVLEISDDGRGFDLNTINAPSTQRHIAPDDSSITTGGF